MKNTLRFKIIMFMVVIFSIFSAVQIVLLYKFAYNNAIKVGEGYAREHVLRKQETIEAIIETAVKMSLQFSSKQVTIDFLQNPEDKIIKKRFLDSTQGFLFGTKADSWFVASAKTNGYYFNNINNDFKDKELRNTLSPTNPNDAWFYFSMKSNEAYGINVDYDYSINMTKVWINIPVYHNGVSLGVVGCGIDYGYFVKQFLLDNTMDFKTMVVDPSGVVVVHEDKKLITHNYKTINESQKKYLNRIYTEKKTQARMQEGLKTLSEHKERMVFFVTEHQNQNIAVAMSYLPYINLVTISTLNIHEVFDMYELMMVMGVLVFFVAVVWLLFYWYIQKSIINPISLLSSTSNRLANGDYKARIDEHCEVEDEIGELCVNFNQMAIRIDNFATSVEERYRLIAENTQDVVWMLGLDFRYIFISPSVYTMRGFTPAELANKTVHDAIDPESIPIVEAMVQESFDELAMGKIPTSKLFMIKERRKDGTSVWAEISGRLVVDEHLKPLHFTGVSRDATHRMLAQESLMKMAFYDHLTSLANRKHLIDKLKQAIENSEKNHTFGAIIYIDLDAFKNLNDTFGHFIGDILLVEVAKRIQNLLDTNALASRFGGDEFVVLVEELGGEYEGAKKRLESLLLKLTESLAQTYHLQAIDYDLTASLGATIFGGLKMDADGVLKEGDIAMYQAKKMGKNQFVIFLRAR